MALDIKHPEADQLARELTRRRGESITEAVIAALREQLRREQRKRRAPGLADELMAIADRFCSRPLLDDRTDEEIIGYENGLPR